MAKKTDAPGFLFFGGWLLLALIAAATFPAPLGAEPGASNSLAELNILAARYYQGDGVPQDYRQAAALFAQAAQRGSEVAQFNLGYMYQNGLGLELDYTLACVYYQAAAGQGYPPARESLANLHRYMDQERIAATTQLASQIRTQPGSPDRGSNPAELRAWLKRIQPAAGGR